MPDKTQEHLFFLNNHDAVISQWTINSSRIQINTFHRSATAGFFTPFQEEDMGVYRSIRGFIFMPLLKLQETASNFIDILTHFLIGLNCLINGQYESNKEMQNAQDAQDAQDAFTCSFLAMYDTLLAACSLLLETARSILFAVTRTLASIYALAMGGVEPHPIGAQYNNEYWDDKNRISIVDELLGGHERRLNNSYLNDDSYDESSRSSTDLSGFSVHNSSDNLITL